MRISSNQVLRAAIAHYRVLPTSGMGDFVYTHPSGTTEGVSLILLFNEMERALNNLEDAEARIRAIGKLLYGEPSLCPPQVQGHNGPA